MSHLDPGTAYGVLRAERLIRRHSNGVAAPGTSFGFASGIDGKLVLLLKQGEGHRATQRIMLPALSSPRDFPSNTEADFVGPDEHDRGEGQASIEKHGETRMNRQKKKKRRAVGKNVPRHRGTGPLPTGVKRRQAQSARIQIAASAPNTVA